MVMTTLDEPGVQGLQLTTVTRTSKARISALFAVIFLCFGLSPIASSDESGADTFIIPLGSYDIVSQIFPSDIIDPKSGEEDPRWLASRLPETIAHYMLSSLTRDGVVPKDFTNYEVVDTGDGYEFHFTPAIEKASEGHYYQLYYPQFLGRSVVGQGLAGADACQEIGSGCWNPVGEGHGSYWRFYPPLGLPFLAQRTVLLTHYPPYRSMLAGDYLNNPTMARWNRILRSAGVEKGTEALYENTVDANPIAAPGAGQGSYFFPVLLASAFFDAPSVGRDYINNMLWLMTQPMAVRDRNMELRPEKRLTLPVLVVGRQSRQLWANKFPDQARRRQGGIPSLSPNDHGVVALSPNPHAPKTPFIAANHPDVGLLIGDDACPTNEKADSYSTEGIWTIEKSDLNVACYAYEMGKVGADPKRVAATCAATWLTDDLSPTNEHIVCTNALMDASYERAKCGWDEAWGWCAANNNNLCAREKSWPKCAQSLN